ncbi:unnamed protein product [Tilletia controversa]|uniref:Hypervirulence associated protein TUDOR domain-containing protein n=3 Tax=Tilletia TaxID=13289 RepID=A0A8X7MY29_9BASI|nr:hypothetical protein CF328_g4502 [Tilletia controversa]KAE8198925.1 hypothetical protein CF336_g1449 [Tilletia laevis]KAE8264252.1 hypothetical protein A4X03_0g1080 [Tilletia caries]KAE8207690.1 hypothetical protein CF335_g960 [Tilletia laevis]KAE8254022.1 hypothetical protein A4X06_0g1106 [Tilletia controversa]
MPQSKDKYTDPKLRDEVKQELMESDKGGKPGQWSARKAQMMASEYKKRGGGYTDDKKDESAKHLDQWSKEDWQTSSGKGEAKNEDGTEERYLPKKAWEKMSEQEKKETNEKKRDASKKGQQFVGNTDKAKASRKKAQKEEREDKDEAAAAGEEEEEGQQLEEEDKEEEKKKKSASKARTAKSGKSKKDDDKDEEVSKQAAKEQTTGPRRSSRKRKSSVSADSKNDMSNESDQEDEPAEKKQKQTTDNRSKASSSSTKKGDTHGSKHDSYDLPAEQASKDRLPKKGQKCHWKAMPGWVEGHVKEILTSTKTVNGKSVRATKDDPRIVLRSHGPSEKLAVHKPDACYFDN